MAPVRNGCVIFNEIPTGYPEPGRTVVYDGHQTIDPDTVPLNGGFLVKILVLSIDPYMRGRMRDPSIASYEPAFPLGKPIDNFGVGLVVRSENVEVDVGQHIYGFYPFREYSIFKDLSELRRGRVLGTKEGLPWSAYVGVCGMPGQTAFYAWCEFSHVRKGDVVFVSAGAGPVGSTVIQLAKQAGCKVIASAGSEEKIAFLKSIGTDVAFNYKTEKTLDVLRKEGPINIYWDNVGGESLEAALDAAAQHARFIMCGMISSYNSENDYPVKNLSQIFAKSLTLYGFTVAILRDKYIDRFYNEVPRMVAEGKIKFKEDASHGLESAGEAILEVQKGRNKGKKLILVAEE
ncbi:alcohol dehydrogenase [Daedalea quercina L-15889]|uniref:Alcohol dehydrogenase n=1 Tax=Daedalea quercina L-15889 TaxID=1314783 RepID=A0A165M5E6_9APHY|nr:alcohol dehydrogenase [Daedalea quercina L-15889]